MKLNTYKYANCRYMNGQCTYQINVTNSTTRASSQLSGNGEHVFDVFLAVKLAAGSVEPDAMVSKASRSRQPNGQSKAQS